MYDDAKSMWWFIIQMTLEEYAALEFPGVEEMSVMFEFLVSGGAERDVELTKKLNPDMPTFEQWAEKNKEAIQALE